MGYFMTKISFAVEGTFKAYLFCVSTVRSFFNHSGINPESRSPSNATIVCHVKGSNSLSVLRAWCFPIWHLCHYFHHFVLSFVIALSSRLLFSSNSFLTSINHSAFLYSTFAPCTFKNAFPSTAEIKLIVNYHQKLIW